MTTLTEDAAEAAAPAGATSPTCERCGAPVQPDQEWCLQCGGARTLIHRPPDWRVPAALVGGVILLALAGLAVVLIVLSRQDNSTAARALAAAPAQTVTVTTPAPATSAPAASAPASPAPPAPPASPPGAASPTISSWPIGLPGWTVVLAARSTETAAETLARGFAARGIPVGVLFSSQHPAMLPNRWVVFSGRYPTRATARARAAVLKAQGFAHARGRVVAPTGG